MENSKPSQFETALARMQEIEREVSDDSLDLEECVQRLDEGVDLAKACMGSVRENLAKENVLTETTQEPQPTE